MTLPVSDRSPAWRPLGALQRGALGVFVLLLAACATRTPAPVENRTAGPQMRPPAAATAPVQAPAQRPAPPTRAARPTTGSSPQTPAPAAVPAAAATIAGTATAETRDSAIVETAPVRPRGVEVRPLAAEVRPLAAPASGQAAASSAAPPASSAAPPASTTAAGQLRREPKVTKRPYSESVLAELRAADGSLRADPAAPVPAPIPAPVPAPAPANAPPPAAPTPKPTDTPATAPTAALDFAWPAKGKVTQVFGESRSTGISIAAAAGDPVSAVADGRVIFSGAGPRGYGNLIIVRHDADTLSVYGHGRALLVKEGQQVRQGQRIAEAGDSGTDKPKLLFEIRKGGKPVDPLKFLPAR